MCCLPQIRKIFSHYLNFLSFLHFSLFLLLDTCIANVNMFDAIPEVMAGQSLWSSWGWGSLPSWNSWVATAMAGTTEMGGAWFAPVIATVGLGKDLPSPVWLGLWHWAWLSPSSAGKSSVTAIRNRSGGHGSPWPTHPHNQAGWGALVGSAAMEAGGTFNGLYLPALIGKKWEY